MKADADNQAQASHFKELYVEGVQAYLDNDFAAVQTLVSRLPSGDIGRRLLEARLHFRQNNYVQAEALLNEIDPARVTDMRLLGDYYFVCGRVAHHQNQSSSQLFAMAQRYYADAGLEIEEARAFLNSLLDLIEQDHYEDLFTALEDFEKKHPDMAEHLRAMLLSHKQRALTCLGEEEAALAIFRELHERSLIELLPRRDRTWVILSEVDCLLTLGLMDEAAEKLEAARDLHDQGVATETLKYLHWRLNWQKEGIAPPVSFALENLMRSFKDRAKFLVDLAQGEVDEEPADTQVKSWFKKEKVVPPEMKGAGKSFYWSPDENALIDDKGFVALKCRHGSQTRRLIETLLIEPRSKWELCQMIFEVSEDEVASDQAWENKLFTLISRANNKVPGLISLTDGNYEFAKTVRESK